MSVIVSDAEVYEVSEEQKRRYHEDGYLVIEGLYTEEECDFLVSRMKQHADPDFASILNADRRAFLARQDPKSSPGAITETATIVRDLMRNPRTVSILEALQGREVVGLQSMILFKEAGSPYASQAWNPHQDNSYPRNPNKQYITANLFLSDADLENGTMFVHRGSHNEDLLPAEDTISFREKPGANPGKAVQVPDKYEKIDLIAKKGDMLILHGNVIHGSYANTSEDRSRPLFLLSYISKGEEFIPGKTAQRMEIPLH